MRNELQLLLKSVRDLPADELPELIGDLERVKAAAWARLATPTLQEHDELLNVQGAARRLGVSTDYLYRHHAKLPFARREGRRLLFSSLDIDKYIRRGGVKTGQR
jgi:excisionase family DNA binding protein